MQMPNEKSTLPQLRAFVKEQGLDIKTSGPGRTKAAILADIIAGAGGAGKPATAVGKATEKAAPTKKAAVEEAVVAAFEEAAATLAGEKMEVEKAAVGGAAALAAEADGAARGEGEGEGEAVPVAEPDPEPDVEEAAAQAPPEGFEWGGTF